MTSRIAAHIDRAEAILADTQPQTATDRILYALALTAVAWVRLEAGLPGEGL